MIKTKSFAIVGGGIGGLTLAVALQQKGINVTVYESAPVLKPLGAGIVLAANALKAFQSLGLDRQIVNAGKEMKQFSIKDQSGRILSVTDAETINRKYNLVNALTLHRADLHSVLLNNLKEGSLQLGKSCTGFDETHDEVGLRFSDGTTARANYVIAADGINSVFRKQLMPSTTLRYAGYTCWRGVVSNRGLNIQDEEASETWGAGKRFGIVPLTNNRVYWFATIDAAMNDSRFESTGAEELLKIFGQFHEDVRQILLAASTGSIIKNDIADIKPLDRFAFGKIVLLGDAAHATTPNLGQGACMAIEDAVVLSNAMTNETDPVRAFRIFETKRIARTTKIVNDSYALGKIGQLSNPALVKFRNSMMKLTPKWVAEKQLKFLYDISFS